MKRKRSIRNLLQRVGRRCWNIGRSVKQLGLRSYIHRVNWALDYYDVHHGGRNSLLQGVPVDRDGKPIPWITYPAINYLEQLDLSERTVFEYGSGNSSKFWAARCQHVTSVEVDAKWFEYGDKNKAENQTMLLRSDLEEYVKTIGMQVEADGGYDIILIDGHVRYDCANYIVEHITGYSLIILDNADWFPNTVKLLGDASYLQIDFIGPTPINRYASCTSFFFQRNAALPLPRKKEGSIEVLAGRKQSSPEDRLTLSVP